MLFKQLTAYGIEMPKDELGISLQVNPHEWRAHLMNSAMQHRFQPLTKHQASGAGWEIPEPDLNKEYLITAPEKNLHLLCYRMDARKIPASAINEALKKHIEKIEHDEKRGVSKLERETFKADIIAQKIPHTLPTPSRVMVVVDLDEMTVLIGTSSEGVASTIKAAMASDLLPEYALDDEEVSPRLLPYVYCRGDAQTYMTSWVRCENDEMPRDVCLGDAVVLQRDKSKNISISGQSMDSQHVQDALNDGYQAFKLPVSIMSGDIPMAEVLLDKYGAFNKITIPDEFKPTIDEDAEDEAWQLLNAELVRTTLNYHYVKQVVMAAFGVVSLDAVGVLAANWREQMASIGCTVKAVESAEQ